MTTLLIDGDIITYQVASSCEEATDWGGGLWTLHAEASQGIFFVDQKITSLKNRLGGNRVIIALTDGVNFRKDILPTYKANRTGVRKPIILEALKQHLAISYETFKRPGLEADDCLGILSTMGDNKLITGDRVIVSIDKDFQQIPGYLYNPNKSELGVQQVTPAQADWYHYYQTLIGDKTDGYDGCPGVGPMKAEKLLSKAGQSAWDVIVKAYVKAGLNEAQALIQARVARILRASDYNFLTKKPILWQPPQVSAHVS